MMVQTDKGLGLGAIEPKEYLSICHQRLSWRRLDISTSEPRGSSISCHIGTETAREVVKKLPGRDEQGRRKIPLHKPTVKREAMGILVSLFQDTQSSAKDIPGRMVLREYPAYFGSAHYRMAATPHSNV